MTPEKLMRLGELQVAVRNHGGRENLLAHAREELESLERELAMAPEVADDPRTLFTDESRRPLLGGGDYLAQQRQKSCDEAKAFALQLAERVGRELAQAALEAAMGALKAR